MRNRSITPVVVVSNELQLFVSLKEQPSFSECPTVFYPNTKAYKAAADVTDDVGMKMFDVRVGELSPLAKKLASDAATISMVVGN